MDFKIELFSMKFIVPEDTSALSWILTDNHLGLLDKAILLPILNDSGEVCLKPRQLQVNILTFF